MELTRNQTKTVTRLRLIPVGRVINIRGVQVRIFTFFDRSLIYSFLAEPITLSTMYQQALQFRHIMKSICAERNLLVASQLVL
jgi:hypothetical protein